jgi:hypothetical protein
MMSTLISQEAMNRVVSHLPDCKEACATKADEVKGVAEGRLAAHRKSGEHQVTITHGDVDSFVNLEGPAAMSVEFGHMVKGKYERSTPKKVAGLYIITGAAGLTG